MTHPYASETYARALAEIGPAIYLENAGTWMLKRNIGDTSLMDIAGCYPVCVMRAEAELAGDFTRLRAAGGLAVALAECAIVSTKNQYGFRVDLSQWSSLAPRALLFGEAHGRVVVSTSKPADVLAVASKHGVPAFEIGSVTHASAGAAFTLAHDSFRAPVDWLSRAFHEAIPVAMDGETPAEHAIAASHAPISD